MNEQMQARIERLTTSYAAAVDAAAVADASFAAVDDAREDDDVEHVVDWSVWADEQRDTAKEALADLLRAADAPRPWIATADGVDEDLGEVTIDEAREAAGDWMRDGSWGEVTETMWVDAYIECELTGERECVTVEIAPDEPECEDGETHDWQSPHETLGGLEENPGVWGHGGGVIIREVCMHCGCERTTDTWAQRPDTGEQGLHSVSYEAEKYAEEIAAKRRAEAVALLADACEDYDVNVHHEVGETGDVSLTLAIDDDGESEEAEAARSKLAAALGTAWDVSWTGFGNTDADGECTSDLRIEWLGK